MIFNHGMVSLVISNRYLSINILLLILDFVFISLGPKIQFFTSIMVFVEIFLRLKIQIFQPFLGRFSELIVSLIVYI